MIIDVVDVLDHIGVPGEGMCFEGGGFNLVIEFWMGNNHFQSTNAYQNHLEDCRHYSDRVPVMPGRAFCF